MSIGLPSEKGNSSLNSCSCPWAAFLWAFLRYRPGFQGDTLKRGAVVQDGPQARKDTQRLKKKHGADILTLAGLHVPPEVETKHLKLIGTTGSGKSTAIRELMYQAIKRRDRAIFADPDGGYLAKFYDPRFGDVILNPFDARSAKWNPLLDVDNAYEADLLAKALIPGESEWNSYARTFGLRRQLRPRCRPARSDGCRAVRSPHHRGCIGPHPNRPLLRLRPRCRGHARAPRCDRRNRWLVRLRPQPR